MQKVLFWFFNLPILFSRSQGHLHLFPGEYMSIEMTMLITAFDITLFLMLKTHRTRRNLAWSISKGPRAKQWSSNTTSWSLPLQKSRTIVGQHHLDPIPRESPDVCIGISIKCYSEVKVNLWRHPHLTISWYRSTTKLTNPVAIQQSWVQPDYSIGLSSCTRGFFVEIFEQQKFKKWLHNVLVSFILVFLYMWGSCFVRIYTFSCLGRFME